MKRLTWVAPLAFLVVMLGGVGIAQATGAWVTTGRQAVVAGQRIGVEDLKGWMTIQEGADGLGLPVVELVRVIGADPVVLTPATKFSEIEALVPGFSLTPFREQLRPLLSPTPNLTPSTAPATTSSTPAPAAASGPGTASGTATASQSIKGSSTLRQVTDANHVDLAKLIAACKLPADIDPNLTLKEIVAAFPGFEVQTVRDAVGTLG